MVTKGVENPLIRRARPAARRLVDAAVRPYLETLIGEIRGADVVSASPDENVPSGLFHGLLHELRTIELERSAGHYERVVSVGASGRWYFDWFENAVGEVVEHIGVEAFEPEPLDLPEYATWRPTTADRFDGVADDDVDLVFAGQTTEHLWAEELAGFLLQARRVLREDGVLVLDSPNRLVTEHLRWSHGGHTVELSASEAAELIQLAGFEVVSMRGLWRCRFGEAVLALEEGASEGATLVRRIVEGPNRADDCFVWWLVAHPSGEPDAAALVEQCQQLYSAHWATRLCRGMWPGPGHDGPLVDAGGEMSVESLPFMMRPGRIRIALRAAAGSVDSITSAELELLLPRGHTVHRCLLNDALTDDDELVWEIDQHELMFALTLRLTVQSSTALRLDMPLSIQELRA